MYREKTSKVEQLLFKNLFVTHLRRRRGWRMQWRIHKFSVACKYHSSFTDNTNQSFWYKIFGKQWHCFKVLYILPVKYPVPGHELGHPLLVLLLLQLLQGLITFIISIFLSTLLWIFLSTLILFFSADLVDAGAEEPGAAPPTGAGLWARLARAGDTPWPGDGGLEYDIMTLWHVTLRLNMTLGPGIWHYDMWSSRDLIWPGSLKIWHYDIWPRDSICCHWCHYLCVLLVHPGRVARMSTIPQDAVLLPHSECLVNCY